MPMKPNYNQQRADRDRAKKKKQQEKLQKREDDAARRKAGRDDHDGPAPASNGSDPGSHKPELQ